MNLGVSCAAMTSVGVASPAAGGVSSSLQKPLTTPYNSAWHMGTTKWLL